MVVVGVVGGVEVNGYGLEVGELYFLLFFVVAEFIAEKAEFLQSIEDSYSELVDCHLR